jgi:hypothetical protein
MFCGRWHARMQLMPPGEQTATGLTHRVVTAQGDAVHTVAGAGEQIGKAGREVAGRWHGRHATKTALALSRLFAAGEPLFPSGVLEKACATMMKNHAFSARMWCHRSAAVPGGRNMRTGRGMGFIESSWRCGPCCARGRAHSVRWAVRGRTDAPSVSSGGGTSRGRCICVHPWLTNSFASSTAGFRVMSAGGWLSPQ